MKDIKVKNTLLIKLILALLGVFVTAMIFSLSIEIFKEKGIWIGMFLSLGLAAIGIYYTEKGDKIRITAWAILISIIVATTLFITMFQIVSKTLDGF